MRRPSSHNRLAFAGSLVAGLLVAVTVGAFAATRTSDTPMSATPSVGIAPTEAMSAFDQPTPAGDALSAAGRKALTSLTEDEPGVASTLLPGNADLARGRTLLSTAGWTLAAAPTKKGRVCGAVLDADGTFTAGGCVDRFTPELPVVPNVARVGSGATFVYGLASDSVKAVAVVVNGAKRQTTLQNDAFFFQPSSDSSIGGVVATLADGSRVTVPLTSSTLGS